MSGVAQAKFVSLVSSLPCLQAGHATSSSEETSTFTRFVNIIQHNLSLTNEMIQLLENQSTVEYYEKFAAHAFENTTQSVISHCVLLKPSGAPVPCAFCFSIRRDIFDLPNIIIGVSPAPCVVLADLT